jgi:hypothetical protein
MINEVVVKIIIPLADSADEFLKAVKSPLVNILELGIGTTFGIKVISLPSR